MDPDADLLQVYATTRSDDAFAQLVRRHLPVVYGAALRRVGGDVHRAQDIAQVVFATVAQNASALVRHPSFGGWLYTTTNHVAANMIRTERRRMAREMAASEMAGAEVQWDDLRPVIDDALLELPERDRHLVLLRFFQDETFAAIGARLGLSESGARLRVEQALDALRARLATRGIHSAAAALGSALVANAATSVPVGVASAVAAAATTAGGMVLPVFMTTFQKGLVATALVALIGTGIHETALVARQGGQLRQLEKQTAELRVHEAQARRERNEARAAATSPQLRESGVPAPAAAGVLDPETAALLGIAARVKQVREFFAARPARSIPELALLTEDDWMKATRDLRELSSETRIREALEKFRSLAKQKLHQPMQAAIRAYAENNGVSMPPDAQALASYFTPPLENAILARYAVEPSAGNRGWVVRERLAALVDDEHEQRFSFGIDGNVSAGGPFLMNKSKEAFRAAVLAYLDTSGGARPASIAQIQPYLAEGTDAEIIREQFALYQISGISRSDGVPNQ